MNKHDSTRRDFMKIMGLGTASLAIPGWQSAAGASDKKPNILFLFTDDQRFDTIHALGNEHIQTPNMDSLVRKGMTFSNAYIMGGLNAAVCMPSRAMVMTGRYLFRLEEQGRSIPSGHVLLPEVLRENGYTTFHTGKWHNGKPAFARSFTTGAKIMFGGMSSHYDIPHHDFDPEGTYAGDQQYRSQEKHSSELYADCVVEFLHGNDGELPFFMFVSFQAPHDPREMPQEYLDRYDPEDIPLPENFLPEHPFDNGELDVRDEQLASWPRTPPEIRRHIAAYYAMITHLDDQIGRILEALEASGQADNTIIIFAGDNGLAVGRHGLMGKQNLYEHSVHVPLIMFGPGIKANSRCDAFCYLSDIFPTVCDLIGAPVPASVEASSLAPSLRGEQAESRDTVFFAYKNFQRGIRTKRWKLILYNVNGRQTTQLFDLQSDPHETTNLAGEPGRQEILFGLKHLMNSWMKKVGDPVNLDMSDWGVPVIPSWMDMRKQRQSK